jgi:hypothetical protein
MDRDLGGQGSGRAENETISAAPVRFGAFFGRHKGWSEAAGGMI